MTTQPKNLPTNSPAAAIDARGLGRIYRVKGAGQSDVVALQDVSLTIPAGEVHGLLGPNGAGKTTLCKILSTILTPTSGTATVGGHDVVAEADMVRRQLGLVLGGDRGLYTGLTAQQNLEFWAAMYGIGRRETAVRIAAVLALVGLQDVTLKAERFSRGMKQRLHLARGLLADPAVLILDEPTIGMDPVSAKAFRDLVRGLNATGTTMLITTHDMAEAEALCQRVSMIDHGQILTTESPAALARLISTYERIDITDLDGDVARELVQTFAGRDEIAAATVLDTGVVRLETRQEGAVGRLLGELIALGHTGIRVGRPTLEEVYVQVIGDRGMRVQ
jgi:ABC-2 type transport system ATP-binding protein